MNEEEEDFVKWMDEVDLEEVNLLEGEEKRDDWGKTQSTGEKLSGESAHTELPPQRGVGWDG